MVAYSTDANERNMDRLVGEDLVRLVVAGKRKLETNEMDANDAVLIYDGRIPVGNEKLDAIIIEMRSYFSPQSEAVIAVPYTPKSFGKFLVHKPKFLAWKNCDDFDFDAAVQAFFEGVGGHDRGSRIWNECLDESK